LTLGITPQAPIISSITQPTSLLPTGSVELSGLPIGNWIINPGGITGNTESTTIYGLADGAYTFTVTNSAGCISAVSAEIIINSSLVMPEFKTIAGSLVVYPNPSNGIVNFAFKTVQDSNVNINLFTVNGALVSHIFKGYLNAEEEQTILYDKTLPRGVYIYQIKTDKGIEYGKLIIDN
jgi:hypothetical protein